EQRNPLLVLFRLQMLQSAEEIPLQLGAQLALFANLIRGRDLLCRLSCLLRHQLLASTPGQRHCRQQYGSKARHSTTKLLSPVAAARCKHFLFANAFCHCLTPPPPRLSDPTRRHFWTPLPDDPPPQ